MSKAIRHNQGKPRWSLVDHQSLEPLVRVLEFGEQKYPNKTLISQEYLLSLFQLWKKENNVQIVIEKLELSQKDFVIPATQELIHQLKDVKSAVKKEELNLKIDAPLVQNLTELKIMKNLKQEFNFIKENILEEKKIKKKRDKEVEEDNLILNIKKKGEDIVLLQEFKNTEFQKIFITKKLKKVVKFVKDLKDYTLIMTMIQGNTEVFYVVNATTELDCLTIMFNFFKKLQIISQNLIIKDNFVITPGSNWKKGLDKTEILESLYRHLIKLMAGQELDDETKLHHIGHIMSNAMFYSYFDRLEKEKNHKQIYISSLNCYTDDNGYIDMSDCEEGKK